MPTSFRTEVLCSIAFALLIGGTATAQQVEPGLYTADDQEGEIQVRRNDGTGALRLKERVSTDFGTATIFSQSNDNQVCRLQLSYDHPLPDALTSGLAVLSFGVDHLVIDSRGSNNNETFTLGATIRGQQAAERIAAHLDVKPVFRAHPGHLMQTRLIPLQDEYEIGDTITLRLEIENVGEVPFSFMDGGMQRGPRNNQFKFIAFRNHGFGKAVLDTGDPTNFGGLAGLKTVKPGEVFQKEVCLNDWFDLKDADSYRITGLFELGLVDEENWHEHWKDFAVGECVIYMREAK